MRKRILFILLLVASAASAQEAKYEKQAFEFIVDSKFSTNNQDHRTVKVRLPIDYSEKEKYPTIYTLDGAWMFEPSITTAKVLSDFDVVPKSIVVGIFHKDRNSDLGINWNTGEFNKESLNFYSFLAEELIPAIDSTYLTSKFNVLIGHSNGATFSHKVLTQTGQPFSGVIALSQNLFGDQLQQYIDFSVPPRKRPIFYFVASGERDATPRLESGMKLDSVFDTNENLAIKPLHKIYDADHSGIAARGITDGIAHMFSLYKHYNDWDENLIGSLLEKNVSSIDFIEQHAHSMKVIYGIDFKVNQDDLSLMSALATNTSEVQELERFEIANFGKSSEFYAMYAQSYEYIKNYEKALEYWNTHLKEHNETVTNFFYYRRPIDLLYKKMNQPKSAIEFAIKWKTQAPKFSPNFNLKIATIASEANIEKKVGLVAIQEFIANYDGEGGLQLEEAEKLERKLKE
jgi:predicted alpha/beta superfamily hydrolase